MKVYVITKGCYSDYSIYAVTLDKEQAELLKAEYSDKWDEARIEEYDSDDNKIEVSDDYTPMWNVIFNRHRSGEIVDYYKVSHDNVHHGEVERSMWSNEVNVYVEAEDEDHAKKIAKDIYMKWLAEQNDL